MVSFQLNHVFKDLLSKYGYILEYSGLGLEHMNLGAGDTIQQLS